MRVTCEHCGRQFALPDEKVPSGKAFSIPCPNCKGPIRITAEAAIDAGPTPAQEPPSVQSPEDDVIDKPFDLLTGDKRSALICVDEKSARDKARAALNPGYHLTEAQNVVDALKKIRAHPFDMIVLHERFEGAEPEENPILGFLERMAMESRRGIFVILLTERFRTFDNLAAFKLSVNLVIHPKHMDRFAMIVEKARTDHESFYRVFGEVLRQL